MKTLNDQRLWIANKTKEKKQRIKEHIDQLNNEDHFTMQEARNDYLNLFGNQSNPLSDKWDKVVVDSLWYVYWIRGCMSEERDTILSENASFWMYWYNLVDKFYDISEWFLNS